MTRAAVVALALLLGGAAPASAADVAALVPGTGWYRAQQISAIDDSQNVYLVTHALESTRGTLGLPVTPELNVNCTENATNVYVIWHTFLDTEEMTLTLRVDQLPASREVWSVSTDFKAAGLWRGSGIDFLRSLFGHERLLVRVTPYGDSPQTAVFNIKGIEDAIVPLMEACHWSMQTAAPSRQEETTRPEDEFLAALRSVEEMPRQRQGEERTEGTGRSRDAAGQARSELGEARLSIGEADALRRQIARCWTMPVGIDGIEDMVVQLRIQVRPDRTVQDVTIRDQARLGRDAGFRAVAQSAVRAIERCSPLNLPPDKYAVWREIDMTFYPHDAISG